MKKCKKCNNIFYLGREICGDCSILVGVMIRKKIRERKQSKILNLIKKKEDLEGELERILCGLN